MLTVTSCGASRNRSPLGWPVRAHMSGNVSALKRWPRSIAPRRHSSATSATNSYTAHADARAARGSVAGRARAATPERYEQLITVRRNAFRLLKLVNTLLDFSRIEAGRVQATYEPTDLAGVTSGITSVFRSAMEKGGLRFSVECDPIDEPVYVDHEMWEKVVSNLLSNAFKFTAEGTVAVTLRRSGSAAELQVRDTGAGIPEDQRARIFERFHRIEGTPARAYEGTGIGLALVQELIKLHGGQVRVESTAGVGSTFIVSIPLGTAHLPPERIDATRSLVSTGIGAEVVRRRGTGLAAGRLAPRRCHDAS